MITQEQVSKMMEEAMPSIIEGFKKELTQHASWQIKEDATALMRKEVTDWVKANIIPEIHKTLVENKEGLIKMAPIMAQEMSNQLGEAFKESIKESLKNSWGRKKIFEAMLG